MLDNNKARLKKAYSLIHGASVIARNQNCEDDCYIVDILDMALELLGDIQCIEDTSED